MKRMEKEREEGVVGGLDRGGCGPAWQSFGGVKNCLSNSDPHPVREEIFAKTLATL